MYKANIFAVCGLRIMLYCKQLIQLHIHIESHRSSSKNKPVNHSPTQPHTFTFTAMPHLCYLISVTGPEDTNMYIGHDPILVSELSY